MGPFPNLFTLDCIKKKPYVPVILNPSPHPVPGTYNCAKTTFLPAFQQ